MNRIAVEDLNRKVTLYCFDQEMLPEMKSNSPTKPESKPEYGKKQLYQRISGNSHENSVDLLKNAV